MKTYYKILHGFNPEDYIEIEDTELQKAYYAFLQKKDAVFSGGAVRGGLIQTIKPDFHRTMGWNRGHKLGEDDFAELNQKGIDKKMQNLLSETKEKVQYLIKTNQTHLIGTNFELPKIDERISDDIKQLAEKMKV